jgi:hypothetical protein
MDPTQPARPPTLSELMLPDACFLRACCPQLCQLARREPPSAPCARTFIATARERWDLFWRAAARGSAIQRRPEPCRQVVAAVLALGNIRSLWVPYALDSHKGCERHEGARSVRLSASVLRCPWTDLVAYPGQSYCSLALINRVWLPNSSVCQSLTIILI